jgi:hypothetical protein
MSRIHHKPKFKHTHAEKHLGTLDRYRKTGGFIQILQLIETCGTQKQEKFLSMIKEEDSRWSDAIQKKMLTMDKILTWSDEVLSEISGNLQELSIAVALHGLPKENHERFLRSFTFAKLRKIEDLFQTNQPSAADISAAYIKIFMEVRKLIHEGVLRADKVDPDIFVEDGIEEKLKRMDLPTAQSLGEKLAAKHQIQEEEEPTQLAKDPSADDLEEIRNLRRKLINLNEENQNLKNENHNLKAKIEHIKKIAA